MFVDSVRQRPTLNPLLFCNCRDASRALGSKRFPTRLMILLHLTSAVALAGSLRLAHRFGIVDLGPVGGPEICWLYLLLNSIGKVWCFHCLTPCCGKGLGSKLSCLYMSYSEAVLLLLMLAPDLSRVANSTTGDHHHAYPWVEMSRDGRRQILTLNFFILVLTNVAPFCLFSALVCKMGMKALEEPPAWQAVVEPCRALSMAIVVIGWALSLYTTGLFVALYDGFVAVFVFSLSPHYRRFYESLLALLDRRGHPPRCRRLGADQGQGGMASRVFKRSVLGGDTVLGRRVGMCTAGARTADSSPRVYCA